MISIHTYISYMTLLPVSHSCTGGTAYKVACGAGKYRATTGATTASNCQNCASGEISGVGASACTPCPAGKTCSGGSISGDCSSGEYALEGDATCTACPTGSICPTVTGQPQVSMKLGHVCWLPWLLVWIHWPKFHSSAMKFKSFICRQSLLTYFSNDKCKTKRSKWRGTLWIFKNCFLYFPIIFFKI